MSEWSLGKGIAVGLIALSIMGVIIAGISFAEFLIRDDRYCECPIEKPVQPVCDVIQEVNGTTTCVALPNQKVG